MYVDVVPNRNSPPAILLRESVREGSKIRKRTLANLSAWPASQIAFLLDRALEKKLRAAGSSLSSPAAWQALETVRCVAVEVGNRTKLYVTRGSRQAAEVLKVLRLSELDPPAPPKGKKTVMY